MSKVYTKTGDKGSSVLANGHKVSKSHMRLECYGLLDEFIAVLGLLSCELRAENPLLGTFGHFLIKKVIKLRKKKHRKSKF